MRLYDERYERLYINAAERRRFFEAANQRPDHIRIFCLTLLYTGCRLSEARALRQSSLQVGDNLLSVRTLKKREKHHVREIPIPSSLVRDLRSLCMGQSAGQRDQLVWPNAGNQPINRITAYRWIKSAMKSADIRGAQACPKGLRHGFGIHAVRSGVSLNLLSRWMGHSSIEITAIYANAVGPEEMEIAQRMWP